MLFAIILTVTVMSVIISDGHWGPTFGSFAVACIAVTTLNPLRDALALARAERKRRPDRKSDEYRVARAMFRRIRLGQKKILRGAGLHIERRKKYRGSNGRIVTKATHLFPRVGPDFVLTEEGFSFELTVMADEGQTVKKIRVAEDTLAANLGYAVRVDPSPMAPVKRARIEVLLRAKTDHLAGPPSERFGLDWVIGPAS